MIGDRKQIEKTRANDGFVSDDHQLRSIEFLFYTLALWIKLFKPKLIPLSYNSNLEKHSIQS